MTTVEMVDAIRDLRKGIEQARIAMASATSEVNKLRAALSEIRRLQPGPNDIWDICNEALGDQP